MTTAFRGTRGFALSGAAMFIGSILLLGALSTQAAHAAPPKPAAARAPAAGVGMAKAVFAGGCFWCEEATFEGRPGVLRVVSGYAGGAEEHPTYEDVGGGRTHHAESVEVTYDPRATTYEKLLDIYWHNIDPTQREAQFCDHGRQYRSAIFYSNEAQRRAALATKQAIEDSKVLKGPIVTEISPLTQFWPAEGYHQDYYKKNPADYQAYRLGCGRDRILREIWGAKAGGH